MKREEAIKLLNDIHSQCCDTANILCTLDADKRCDALQMAKKGIREEIKKGYNRGMHHYYCPVCYEKGDLRNKYNVGSYCSGCGQKLDWSGEE